MKGKRKKGMILGVVGAFMIALGFPPIFFWTYAGNGLEDMEIWLLILSVFLIVVGIVVVCIGFKFRVSIDEEFLKRAQTYRMYPSDPFVDYKQELESVRNNFYNDGTPDKNFPYFEEKKGVWPRKCCDYSVIAKGKIYYGMVVKANNRLFEKKFARLAEGAVLAYSTDEFFERNPLHLQKIIRNLYSRGDSAVRKILADDHNFFTNYLVDPALTDGRTVYLTTVVVYRLHLPEGCFSDSLVPLIAAPEQSTSSFLADAKYWTRKLIGNFVHGETNRALRNMGSREEFFRRG